MEKRQLEYRNKLYIYIIFLFLFIGCNKKNENIVEPKDQLKKVVFKDMSFNKLVDDFIKDANQYPVRTFKSIMVKTSINDESDTIVSIINFRPYETINLVAINTYKEYKLYFYCPKELRSDMNKYIDLSSGKINSVELLPIDESEIDLMYIHEYIIKNNVFHSN